MYALITHVAKLDFEGAFISQLEGNVLMITSSNNA